MVKENPISLSLKLRSCLYLVTPNETSFEKLEEVPDYIHGVCFFNSITALS